MLFCNIHAELIPFLQHSSAPGLDKNVEACGKLVHAAAQVVKAKVDAGQLVRHGGCVVRRGAHCRAEGRLERSHRERRVRSLVCRGISCAVVVVRRGGDRAAMLFWAVAR
jgi:hypothetical protein